MKNKIDNAYALIDSADCVTEIARYVSYFACCELSYIERGLDAFILILRYESPDDDMTDNNSIFARDRTIEACVTPAGADYTIERAHVDFARAIGAMIEDAGGQITKQV